MWAVAAVQFAAVACLALVRAGQGARAAAQVGPVVPAPAAHAAAVTVVVYNHAACLMLLTARRLKARSSC